MLVAENCGGGSRVRLGLSGAGTRTHAIPDAYPSKPAALRPADSGGRRRFPHKLPALYNLNHSPSTLPVPTVPT